MKSTISHRKRIQAQHVKPGMVLSANTPTGHRIEYGEVERVSVATKYITVWVADGGSFRFTRATKLWRDV